MTADQSLRALRLAAAALLGLAALISATGMTQAVVFHQPSELKYAITVAAPLVLLLAVTTASPARVLVPALIVGAPFGSFVMTFHGVSVSALAVLLVLAVAATVADDPPRAVEFSRTGAAACAAVPLLAIPLLVGSAGRTIGIDIAAMIATGWVVSRMARSESGLRLVLGALVLAATVQGLIAIWEFETGHLLNLYGSAGNQSFGADYFFGYGSKNRPVGSFFDPISLGNVLSLGCPVALSLVVSSRAAMGKAAAGAAFLIIGVGLVLSLSRDSWIAAALGSLFALLAMPAARRRAIALPAFCAVAAVILLASSSSGGILASRFNSIFHPTAHGVRTAQGDRERKDDWSVALRIAGRSPVVGVGFGNLVPYLEDDVPDSGASSNAQSTYLQILAEAGILGALALAVVIFSLARDLTDAWSRRRVSAAGMGGALLALLVGWVTDYTIRYSMVAVMVAVLMGAIASGSVWGRQGDARYGGVHP